MAQSSATDSYCDGLNIDFTNANPSNTTQRFFYCEDSDGSTNGGKFNVYSNGQIRSYVHYGTAAGSTQTALYVDNSGYFGKVTSLREHKTKISDMEDISWLYNVRPVNFEYKVLETKKVVREDGKSEECRTGKRLDKADGIKQYGMIAEELAEVSGAESLLEYCDDELSGISYHKFVPILVKAVQELSAKVDALENNNQQGESSNEQEESSDGGNSSSESSGQDSGGAEADSSDSSGAASGASEASESSSDNGDQSSGSSGGDSSDDSEGGSGGDDS
jgi:hypothetical protein